MRRILSITLCAAMLLGCVFSAVMTANAAETVDEPSASTSYRDEFIAALLENEDTWYDNGIGCRYAFIDLNMDGEVEFVEQSSGSSGTVYNNAYYFDSTVKSVTFEGSKPYSAVNYKAYYDKTNKKYRMFAQDYSRAYSGQNMFEVVIGNEELTYSNGILSLRTYSLEGGLDDFLGHREDYKFYDSDRNEISEEEYNKINNAQISNCVDVNMKYDILMYSDYNKLSDAEKKTALERLYDSFTYDKYDDTDTDTDTEYPAPDVEIKGFELEYGIGCGETKTIYDAGLFGTNIEFKSSNEKIAKIERDGLGNVVVTGVSGGTATLTATDTVSGATATCEVKVYNDTNFKIGVDNLSFANSTDNFFNGFDSFMNDFSKVAEEHGWNFFDFMMVDRKDKPYSINYLSSV